MRRNFQYPLPSGENGILMRILGMGDILVYIFQLQNNLLRRQLEAIIRISESLAKMQLQSFVSDAHVAEALRLFQVSTLEAATSESFTGTTSFFLLFY